MAPADHAESRLLVELVDLHDHPVGLVREGMARPRQRSVKAMTLLDVQPGLRPG